METIRTLVAILSLVITSYLPQTTNAMCEKIQIPMCQDMPWNMTRMPNLLHHSTQKNAILAVDQFEPLVATRCSPYLLFFLCSMYAPICTMDFDQGAIPPCKSICENARRGCEPVMLRYNVSWPSILDCSDLPIYDRGVCISPDAIVSSLSPGNVATTTTDLAPKTKKKKKDRRKKQCRCKKFRLRQKAYNDAYYDFAIQGKWKSSNTNGNGITNIYFTVVDVIRGGQLSIKKGSDVMMLTNETCVCPKFKPMTDYLIVGHDEGRMLLYTGNSMAITWKSSWPRIIKRWDKRFQRSNPGKTVDDSNATGKKTKGKKKKRGDRKNKSNEEKKKKAKANQERRKKGRKGRRQRLRQTTTTVAPSTHGNSG